MGSENHKQKLNERFIHSWAKKRTNRWLFALKESVLYALFFSVIFHFLGDDFRDFLRFGLTFFIVLIVNFLFSFFLSFSVNEARFKKLHSLDSQGK